jgi:hypothetical protein
VDPAGQQRRVERRRRHRAEDEGEAEDEDPEEAAPLRARQALDAEASVP